MGLGAKTKMNTKMRGRKKRKLETQEPHDDAAATSMDFFNFPRPIQTQSPPAPFRDRMKEFLSSAHALPSAEAEAAWRVPLLLRLPDGSQRPLPIFIVDEDVTASSRSLYCDHCRVVGWSGHPVCRRRYHMIIKREDETTTMRMSSGSGFAEELEDNTHLLHAVVHSNGFGHILTLNGRQGGSPHLSGRQIMDFWDRLSLFLSVRKVSVMDASKKHGAEYRLLHAVARGQSWYGNWGYEFGAGSYALTQHAYRQALHSLSTIPLSLVLLSTPRSRLHSLISLYQSLSLAELSTFGDLFSFLLNVIPRVRAKEREGVHSSSCSGVVCAWTRGDVEHLQQAMLRVLRASSNGWVARRALKGAMCKSAASLELLDYCLKHFGGTVTSDRLVVHSRCNSSSASVEYRLEPVNNAYSRSAPIDLIYPSEQQVLCDLQFLYNSLLNPDLISNDIPKALRDRVIDSATKLLDCKQFVKVNMPEKFASDCRQAIRLWCDVQLLDQPKGQAVIPAELVVLPSKATVGDLKQVATQAFREVYVMLKTFQAEGLAEFGSAVDDSMTLNFLVGSSGSIRLTGKCTSKHGLSRFRMERGVERWTVNCSCGAKDDDGERMLACDVCGVWQHTRCVGIAKSDAIPAEFVCSRCTSPCHDDDLPLVSGFGENVSSVSLSGSTCRGKAVGFGVLGLTANLAIPSDVG